MEEDRRDKEESTRHYLTTHQTSRVTTGQDRKSKAEGRGRTGEASPKQRSEGITEVEHRID
jgi:hypothetical protein